MSSNTGYYEHYRASSIGSALMDTLDDLVNQGRITGSLAIKVLAHFDRAIAETLVREAKVSVNIRGYTKYYTNRDPRVYVFMLENVTVEIRRDERRHQPHLPPLTAPLLKIVAMQTKRPAEVEAVQ